MFNQYLYLLLFSLCIILSRKCDILQKSTFELIELNRNMSNSIILYNE